MTRPTASSSVPAAVGRGSVVQAVAAATALAAAVIGASPVATSAGPSVQRSSAPTAPAVERLAADFEVFFTDLDESPGSVYRYRPATGTVEAVYTRASGTIASFDLYYYPSKLYFTSGSDRKIRRVDYVSGSWQSEQEVFEHGTYVRDIAVRDDSGSPLLLFSEASGAGGDGRIYALEYGKAVERFRVRLSEVHGYWAGDFSYDPSGTLYLSSGNTDGARIYRVTSGTPTSVYQAPSGSIVGFALEDGAVYHADNDTTIYRVQLSSGSRTTVHDSAVHTLIVDVQNRGDEPAVPTPTSTRTATRAPSPTPSRTPSPTPSRTPSPTPSRTPSPTRTATTMPTSTATPAPSASPTLVASATATHTAAATEAATATTVPTATGTPTATVVPTAPITPGTTGRIQGALSLDGRTDHRGASVRIDGVEVATSDASGRYVAAGIAPGTHAVDLRHAGYLRAGERTVTAASGAVVELPSAVLLGGDANGDDAIDITDGGIIAARYGTSVGEPAFDARADINGDGTIDIHDLVMIGGNFGCTTTGVGGRCRRWADR